MALHGGLHPRQVGAELEVDRAFRDMPLIAGEDRQLLLHRGVAHDDHAVGLDVRGGRRAERSAEDRLDLRLGHRFRSVFPDADAVMQHLDGLAGDLRGRGGAYVVRHGFSLPIYKIGIHETPGAADQAASPGTAFSVSVFVPRTVARMKMRRWSSG